MRDRFVHRQPLGRRLLPCHDHVDVLPAAQAVVGDRQKRVGIGRQIDADHFGLLVDDVVEKSRILMREAVVVLPPNVGREQIVERRDRPAPRDAVRRLQPLGVLVEHRVHDVDESLIARKEAVPAGQEIALEPTLALVLREHLHHAPVFCDMVVARFNTRDEAAVGHFEHGVPPVRRRFIRREDAEVARGRIELHHVAQERPLDARRLGIDAPGRRNRDRVRLVVRQTQIPKESAAVGVRVRAHASCAFGSEFAQRGNRSAVLAEQFIGPVAL